MDVERKQRVREAAKLLFYLNHEIDLRGKVFWSYLVITFQVEIDTLRSWQNLHSGSLIPGVRAIMVVKPRPPPFNQIKE